MLSSIYYLKPTKCMQKFVYAGYGMSGYSGPPSRRTLKKIMRISLFVFLGMLITAQWLGASSLNGQNLEAVKVSLPMKNESLIHAFQRIEKQSPFRFMYRKEDVRHVKGVSHSGAPTSLDELLRELLTPNGLSFKQVGQRIMVMPGTGSTDVRTDRDAENTVALPPLKGKVKDENGDGLPGVSILVKGSQHGTITDGDGNFSLNIPEGDVVLVFSFVGYATQEQVAGNNSVLEVTMKVDEKSLEEVVVVGYGTQKRELVTGAVSSVSAKDLKNMPTGQVGQQLQGRMPGVRVNQSTGTPGEGMSFRIRGQASIGAGNAPLVVIDGFPSSTGLESINPADIESISVLKDAASTSLYGSRAANGVFLVTTKQGKSGATEVEFSAWAGIQNVPQRGRPNVMNAREFAQYKNEWYSDQGLEVPERYRNPSQYGPNDGTDWFDVLLNHNAPTQNYQLSISNGSDKVSTSISAGYNKQEGVMLNTFAERFTARANNLFRVSPKLTFGLNLASSYRNSQNLATDGTWSIISGAYIMDPTLSYKNDDGTLPVGYSSPGMFPNPNWFRVLTERENPLVRKNFIVNAFGELEIIKGLKYKLKADADIGDSKSRYWSPSTAQGGMFTAPPTPAAGSYSTSGYSNWQVENTLNYFKTIGGNHNFEALAGYSAQKVRSESSAINGTEFPDDEISWITAASVRRGDASVTDFSVLSAFGRLNYDYKNRYLVSVAVRRDGSSRFGDNKKYGTFPSVSAGWIVSGENFMRKFDKVVSFLKVRASYGEVGNYNIGNYTHLSTIGNSNYAFNDVLAAGKTISNLGNQLLTWETTVQTDIGLDLGLFNDRIFLLYDYYRKRTNGLLYSVNIPLASGFGSIQSNIGEFEFWGHEFGLETRNLTGALKWNTNLAISLDRNMVNKLGTEDTPIGGYQENVDFVRTAVGHPIGQFYGYVYDGVFMNQEELNRGPQIRNFGGSTVGSARLKDISGPDGVPDGFIDAEYDKTFIGNPNPRFNFGFTNRLSYERFDLDVHMVGRVGGDLFMGELLWTENLDGVFNVRPEAAQRWRSPENPGNGDLPKTNSNPLHRFNNSRHIFDGTYLSVRNITLGYRFNIPANGVIKGARLYLNMQNALMLTKYPGMNPEASEAGLNGLNEGRDFGHYPVPRIFTVGADFKF
ncbi:TonB-dependent receptor [Ravibacter arvi]|uniref:TonB-dependent receptor n=2 Tax=Ravibacter arvi TaxID=2051041 RepID=A0ABP8LV04_9BACT